MILFYLGYIYLVQAGKDCWSPDSPYTGTKNTLPNRQRCQMWESNRPQREAHYPIESSSNYCRNPDNDPAGPWCYSSKFAGADYSKFNYCDIPKCKNFKRIKNRKDSCSTDSSYYQG